MRARSGLPDVPLRIRAQTTQMNDLPGQIHDAEEQVQLEKNFPASECAGGNVEVCARNRVRRECEEPACFLVDVELELFGQYGSPNETLADHDLRNHQP